MCMIKMPRLAVRKAAAALGAVVAGAALPAFAEIRMGAPFTDGVVLQRGMNVPVWGWATPSKRAICS